MTPIYSQSAFQNNQLIIEEVTNFIVDRQSSRKSSCTLKYYEGELDKFVNYLASNSIRKIKDLQPTHIRQYLIELSNHRNPGGCHAAYRAIRVFLRWYAQEIDDPAYERLIKKVTPPKVVNQPIQGVTMDQLRNLLATCDRTFTGMRDRAILVTMIDTGLRANELLKLNINDIDFKTGSVQVRAGKGGQDRTVFVNAVARKEILRYLRLYPNPKVNSPLWLNTSEKRLKYFGLREMLRRRAEKAGIVEQSSHDFRRGFSVESWRNGCDLEAICRIMGHKDIKTTQRYIKLLPDDLRKAHESSSPADNL
jgi:integrase/recombinase XerC